MGPSILYLAAGSLLVTVIVALILRDRSRTRSRRIRALIDRSDGLLGPSKREKSQFDAADDIDTLERSLTAIAAEIHQAIDRLKIDASHREAILSSIGEGVLAVDKDLRVVFCNEAIIRAMGARRPVPDRLPLLELVRDADILEILTEVVRSGTASKRSLKIAAANNRSFNIYAAPLEGVSGRGAIAIFHDITDLERMEQVRKDFIANVSHEMRTPLASIIAYSDTLLDGALQDIAVNRNFVEVIRSNAVRLNSIAADLLILSDLESGVSPGEPEPVCVGEILETALKNVQPEAVTNRVTIVPNNFAVDVFVTGHRLRLEQALLNLVANAVKFNRPGGEVRLDIRTAGDSNVQIAVSDTGIGIPSQDLPRIFERFYRVDRARSRQAGGTGLGLSIVKHVIEAMNGTISVASQLGKGSTFTITLPATQLDVPEPDPSEPLA